MNWLELALAHSQWPRPFWVSPVWGRLAKKPLPSSNFWAKGAQSQKLGLLAVRPLSLRNGINLRLRLATSSLGIWKKPRDLSIQQINKGRVHEPVFVRDVQTNDTLSTQVLLKRFGEFRLVVALHDKD